MRQVMFSEPVSGLACRCDLLDDRAPVSARFLWSLAEVGASFDAIHAMWTGPEISIPIPAPRLPAGIEHFVIPEENATSYPEAGEIVLAYAGAGSIKGLPPGDFYDLGLFYADGGRLLMPFGWLRANVCARIVADQMAKAQADFRTIRTNGACRITVAVAA